MQLCGTFDSYDSFDCYDPFDELFQKPMPSLIYCSFCKGR
jgi:hypothetical protein